MIETLGHLPECWSTDPAFCICDRLRACEQRLTSKVWEASGVDLYRYGYAAGVQAAYSAVELRWQKEPEAASDWLLVALAAIDGLRGES